MNHGTIQPQYNIFTQSFVSYLWDDAIFQPEKECFSRHLSRFGGRDQDQRPTIQHVMRQPTSLVDEHWWNRIANGIATTYDRHDTPLANRSADDHLCSSFHVCCLSCVLQFKPYRQH